MGRYLDQLVLDILSADQKLSLAIFRVKDPQLPQDFQGSRSMITADQQLNHEFTVFDDSQTYKLSLEDRERDIASLPVLLLEGDRIAAYSLLRDIYGNSAMLLKADMPRTVYQQGERSLQLFRTYAQTQ